MKDHSIKGFIELTMEFRKEGDLWTGVCKELGTAADGENFDEVVEALYEMVTIHLNTLEDTGECERFLHEHGIDIHRSEPIEPANVSIPCEPNHYINRRLVPLGKC